MTPELIRNDGEAQQQRLRSITYRALGQAVQIQFTVQATCMRAYVLPVRGGMAVMKAAVSAAERAHK